MSAEVKDFGTLENGTAVKLYTLTNGNGTEASFTDLGAAWVSMKVRDKDGNVDDVVLGYDDPETYFNNPTSCGECIGRCAGRTGNASFTIDGQTYELGKNEGGKHNRHSGPDKWCTKVFSAETEEGKLGSRVTFRLETPDGSQGFPGNLSFAVSYTLGQDDSLIIEYLASADRKTVINPTNHAYFNLGGHGSGSILNEEVWINADKYTPIREDLITSGEIASVEGTPLDFTIMKPIGQDIDADSEQIRFAGGFDHNYCVNGYDGTLNLVAKAKHPENGRRLKVYTDLPGLQFYTGNSLKAEAAHGKGGAVYGPRTGYCFETQFFPDAVNKADWEKPVFGPGEEYHHFTVYRFAVKTDADEEEED